MDHERRPAIGADHAARGSRADGAEPSDRVAVERAHGGVSGDGDSSDRLAVERADRRFAVRQSHRDGARSGHTDRDVVVTSAGAAVVVATAGVAVVVVSARFDVAVVVSARFDVAVVVSARFDVVVASTGVDVVVAPTARLSRGRHSTAPRAPHPR
jgi:hypothetical protein